MDVLIGADPEFFLKKGGKDVSAYGLVPGDKRDPHKVKDGAVQRDGLAVEFNIDPAESEDQFVHNIDSVMAQLRDMIPNDVEFNINPHVEFDTKYYEDQPDETKELGCDPDYNAYTMQSNKSPEASPLRAAGGHVHIGWTEGQDVSDRHHVECCADLAKQLDFYLGVPSVLLDEDKTRRSLYGMAGAFRPKPYGMEYRTLSNFWLKDDKLKRFVYRGATMAVNKLVNENYQAIHKYGEDYRNLIDNSDTERAKVYCGKIKPLKRLVEDAK